MQLPEDLLLQLKIEKFSDEVSRTLFQNSLDPLGILPEIEQASTMSVLRVKYRELEALLAGRLTGESYLRNMFSTTYAHTLIAFNKLYFLATGLHLHGFAFFIPRASAAHSTELLHSYNAATVFIQTLLDYEANTSSFLRYCPSPLQFSPNISMLHSPQTSQQFLRHPPGPFSR
jgi:hypothetical protein